MFKREKKRKVVNIRESNIIVSETFMETGCHNTGKPTIKEVEQKMSRMRFTSEEREVERAKLERFNFKIEH